MGVIGDVGTSMEVTLDLIKHLTAPLPLSVPPPWLRFGLLQ